MAKPISLSLTTLPSIIKQSKMLMSCTFNLPTTRLSCRATTANNNPYKPTLDRRNMVFNLIGIAAAVVAAGLSLSPSAVDAAPIVPPDLTKCLPPSDPSVLHGTVCCLPPPKKAPINFKPPGRTAPLRVRPAAHLVDSEYIAKYTRAVKLMKELPANDPRNFMQQANVHCAFCDGVYDQYQHPGNKIQVHESWLFFPWHRLFIYFHERILGKLIGDDTFALPFWNWDAPQGMSMPLMYTHKTSPLYNALRNANHQPPAILNYGSADPDDGSVKPDTPPGNVDKNLKTMYRQMVSGGKTAELFMGYPYRAGDDATKSSPGSGTIELIPHNSVHDWTGVPIKGHEEDMGIFYSAARDPIFSALHSNIDRMWAVWKTLDGGNRKDFSDPDWLDASFLFYDENKDLVKVKVRDCLEPEALGYKYQDVPIDWLNTRPTPSTKASKNSTEKTTITKATAFPLALKSPITTTLKRPKRSRSNKEKEDEEEVLAIEGIEFESNEYIKFDVYINCPNYKGIEPDSTEFAGSFVHVPHKHKHVIKTSVRLGITDLLEDLKAEADEEVLVTLVPKKGKVKIGRVEIQFST